MAGGDGVTEGAATVRMFRTLGAALAVGGTIFDLLDLSAVVDQASLLRPWFAIGAPAALFGLPIVLGLVCLLAPVRVLRGLASLCAVAFLATMLLWLPAMTVSAMPGGASPWPLNVSAVSTAMAAFAWRSWAAWTYTIAVCVLCGTVRFLSAGTADPRVAIQDTLQGILICAVFVALIRVTVQLSRQRDAAAADARREAARAAATFTREREIARFNALVHDDIISTLLAAGRASAPPELLRAQADGALRTLSGLTTEAAPRHDYGPEEFVATLRSTVTEQSSGVGFSTEVHGTPTVPAAVVAAISQALGEAVRNSLRHAIGDDGGEVDLRVDLRLDPQGVRVVVRDDGQGFDVDRIGPERLGIAISIRDRMSRLPGGTALVESTPEGTTVTIGWSR